VLPARAKDAEGILRRAGPHFTVIAIFRIEPGLPYRRRIVCLANSRKYQGRCIAGLEWGDAGLGDWVRPIGVAGKGELHAERLYSDGTEPQPFEIVEIGLVRPVPSGCHQEDQLVDPQQRWIRRGTLYRWSLFSAIEDVKGCLWFDGGSTFHGENDKIPAEAAGKLKTSLKLIQPNRLTISVQLEKPRLAKTKRAIRGSFSIAGFDYILSVTDSFMEEELRDAPEGTTRTLARPILCLSVSELFEKTNCCYKLIAGVLG
jgi:hypothetical protein